MSATNRGAERCAGDFYPTPLASFEPLIQYLPISRFIWEPACGDGRLVSALLKRGFKAGGDDLNNSYDFLKDNSIRECIVTNPPFSLAQEFVSHATSHCTEVYMLLRLNFLGAKKRKTFWKKNEPNAIFVLSERPKFVNNRSDACEYGWFYWGYTHSGIIHL